MKKILSLILILALAVPALALAENTDPIVGAWYVLFDYKELPSQPAIEGKDYMLNMFFFEPSGAMTFLVMDAKKDNTRETQIDGAAFVISGYLREMDKKGR